MHNTNHASFRLKGSLFTLSVLQLLNIDKAKFTQQINELIEKAPKLFHRAPIIIDLTQLTESADEVDLVYINTLLHERGLIPVGVKCNKTPALVKSAVAAGLAVFPDQHATKNDISHQDKKPLETVDEPEALEKEKPIKTQHASKIITKPVRSGQQIYAQGGDLVILAAVGAGAEILADGHIHVYGPLRGRALAGIKGDTTARILCQNLEAELISIAGRYLVSEHLKPPIDPGFIQVFLEDDRLQIEALA
ncbi:septum site-determining protein MinC [soil metagenome]